MTKIQETVDSFKARMKATIELPIIYPFLLTVHTFFYDLDNTHYLGEDGKDPYQKSGLSKFVGVLVMLLAVPATIITIGLGLIAALGQLIAYPFQLLGAKIQDACCPEIDGDEDPGADDLQRNARPAAPGGPGFDFDAAPGNFSNPAGLYSSSRCDTAGRGEFVGCNFESKSDRPDTDSSVRVSW